jgi:hypothetical protein
MWKVIAYTGKRGDIHMGRTFVRASCESSAISTGKAALRLIGVRGRYVVNVSRYYPWLDRELAGYIGYSGPNSDAIIKG